MPETGRDLWPEDIAVDALSPAMILNEQSEALSKKTKGLVHGELLSDEAGDVIRLQFDLVAPAAGFRQRLLAVRYYKDQRYPAVLTAPQLAESSGYAAPDPPLGGNSGYAIPGYKWPSGRTERECSRVANTPADFEALLGSILGSTGVKAAIFSLIARTNETKSPPRMRYQSLPVEAELRVEEHVQPDSPPGHSEP